MSLGDRIKELDSPLNSSQELGRYLRKLRDLCRDVYLEISFAADELQENLSTLPVADSRYNSGVMGSANSKLRARKVAGCLRRGAEAQKYVGTQAVRTWREFTRAFAPEIEARRRGTQRRGFKVD